jgi:hypothetical protein
MDVLIKRKKYEEALEFLYEKSNESDWNIFVEAIKNNPDFLDYFKKFLAELKCVFRLKTFLLKIFCTNKDKQFQEIVYEIISNLHNSKSEFSSHFLIKNLLLIQTVKLVVLDQNNRSKLLEYIKDKTLNDEWFIELLDSFQFWMELGIFYEIRGDFEKSLEYYKRTDSNEDKINELIELICRTTSSQKDELKIDESQEDNCEDLIYDITSNENCIGPNSTCDN